MPTTTKNDTDNNPSTDDIPVYETPLAEDPAKRLKIGRALLRKYWGVQNVSGMPRNF